MRLYPLLLLLGLFLGGLSSCDRTHRASEKATTEPTPRIPAPVHWQIGTHRVGPFVIGHHLREYQALLKGVTVDSVEAWPWGIDGGGTVLLVRQGADSLVTLVPYDDTDSLIFMSVMTDALRTENGVHVGMSVGQLLTIYPNLRVMVNALGGGEYSYDAAHGWTLQFLDDSTIGDYKDTVYDSGEKAIPVNLKPRLSRIIVH